MTPATAYLTFSEYRAAQVDLTGGDRRELARRASGIHATEAAARDYARREGPAVILTPTGELLRVELARDAAEDARIAAEQTEFAERLRGMTWREATAS